MDRESPVAVEMRRLWRAAGKPTAAAMSQATGLSADLCNGALNARPLIATQTVLTVAQWLAVQACEQPQAVQLRLSTLLAQQGRAPRTRERRSRALYAVMDLDGGVYATVMDDHHEADRLAQEHAALVVQLPVIADYTYLRGGEQDEPS